LPLRDSTTLGYPGEALATYVLVEQRGKTILTLTILYESREARDAALKSGMERGVVMSYNRLEELLASLGAPNAEKGASV